MSKTAETMHDEEQSTQVGSLPGWDPLVRLTHWGIALAVLLNGLIIEDESDIHIWIGYAALTLLALRLVWGVVGSKNARFSSFPPSMGAAIDHVLSLLEGRARHDHPSHNPAGALMVYAMWAALLIVSVTGVAIEGLPFQVDGRRAAIIQPMEPTASASLGRIALVGPAYASDDEGSEEHGEYGEREEEEGDEFLEEIHEFAANLLLIFAAVHVGGVFVESKLSKRNLAREMLTGRRGKI